MKSNSLVPELAITDYERSLEFYTKVLGFTIEYQRVEEGFAYMSLGESQIMIDQIGKTRTWKTGEFEYPLGRGINLQIKVAELYYKNNLKQESVARRLNISKYKVSRVLKRAKANGIVQINIIKPNSKIEQDK